MYNLATNATNERVGAVSQANITISSNPAVDTIAPLATARYTISSGLVDNSNYSVAVTVNLQGADAGRATSARGLSGRRYLPANGVRIGVNDDSDQYANVEDNCPAIKNDDQANTYGGADNMGDACGDIDNDGIADATDNCAVIANTDQLDTNGNGMGDVCDSALDSDGDSIANDRDNCPLIANPNQEDGDRDNVGDICDVDADGDGLINGTQYVGGLVGESFFSDTTISSSVVTVGSISGTQYVGGLVGAGNNAAISFSVATVGSMIGTDRIGGLVGIGERMIISSSLATVGSISGSSNGVGGLVGTGEAGTIISSLATVGAISGADFVSGLVGYGLAATINYSVAITNSINGTTHVGGFVGASGLLFGIDTDPSNVTSFYWDATVSLSIPQLNTNTAGSSQTTAALTIPTDFTDIYATWANAWCNPATGEFITDSSSALAIDANRVWDLGTASQYPAITCVPNLFSLADQREAARCALAGELPLVD